MAKSKKRRKLRHTQTAKGLFIVTCVMLSLAHRQLCAVTVTTEAQLNMEISAGADPSVIVGALIPLTANTTPVNHSFTLSSTGTFSISTGNFSPLTLPTGFLGTVNLNFPSGTLFSNTVLGQTTVNVNGGTLGLTGTSASPLGNVSFTLSGATLALSNLVNLNNNNGINAVSGTSTLQVLSGTATIGTGVSSGP